MNNLYIQQIQTNHKEQFINITAYVNDFLKKSGVTEGICHIYVPHTTAGITINEGADPSVIDDILTQLNKLIPQDNGYTHLEGNSAAHIKSFLSGNMKTVLITEGSLLLGTWQKIFLCEFDGPRSRKFFIKIINDY